MMGTELVSAHSIDSAYRISTIAHDMGELRKRQAEMMHMQMVAASAAMAELSVSVEQLQVSRLVAQNTAIMAQGINRLSSGLEQLQNTASEQLTELRDVRHILDTQLSTIAQHQLKQQQTLDDIAATLRAPYETSVRELREAAHKWLTSGNQPNRPARDREEDWADAIRLLRITTENPIGRQDYMAWFQLGYLLWMKDNNFTEAEEAFYRAQRLSSSSHDAGHILALRHLAHMQYLQGKHTDAYATIQPALELTNDHEIHFEAARYAACTDQLQNCAKHLEHCIALQPTTSYMMFGEPDFKRSSVLMMLTEMAAYGITVAHTQATDAITHSRRVLSDTANRFVQIQCRVPLSDNCYASLLQLTQEVPSADLLQALTIKQRALEMMPLILGDVIKCLTQEVDNRVREIDQKRNAFGYAKRDHEIALKQEAKAASTVSLQPTKSPGIGSRLSTFVRSMSGSAGTSQATQSSLSPTNVAGQTSAKMREAHLEILWADVERAEEELSVIRKTRRDFEAQLAVL
jgi:tetratricopeptide (TPR) repeat protein